MLLITKSSYTFSQIDKGAFFPNLPAVLPLFFTEFFPKAIPVLSGLAEMVPG